VARRKRRKTSSTESEDWWKVTALSALGFGVFGAVLTFAPDYSPWAMKAAAGMTLSSVIVVAWRARTNSWYSQIMAFNMWMLFLLGIGIRFWSVVVPALWLWLPLIISGYFGAMALPAIRPRLASFLAREQVAPQTKLGRGCLTWTLLVFSGGGATGFWLYSLAKRTERLELAFLVSGALCFIVAVAATQFTWYRLWPTRPWAKEAEGKA